MTKFHLAQINIARLKAPIDSELLEDFVSELDNVNQNGESSPGFIWRLKDEEYPTGIELFDDPMTILNLTVWESVEALKEFTYRNREHAAVFKKRMKWFERTHPHLALWWIPAGHLPTLAEAKEKLDIIGEYGPGQAAFDLKNTFAPQMV